MFQRGCLSFRAFSDIGGCVAGQILQIYTLARKSMVYGILNIQILEDVQVLTDAVDLCRGNQNRLNRCLCLHELYPWAEEDIFLRIERREARATQMQN